MQGDVGSLMANEPQCSPSASVFLKPVDMKLPSVIYLDTAFITDLYEAARGIRVPIRVTRKSARSAEISGWILKGGASTEEEKEFPVTSRKMYEELDDVLGAFPKANLDTSKDVELPELFWTEGIFCGGRSSLTSGSEQIASTVIYRLQTSIGDVKRFMNLVTCDSYFVSGYDQLSKYGYALTVGFGIRAQLLIRLLYLDKHYPVGAPMIIVKTSNSVASD